MAAILPFETVLKEIYLNNNDSELSPNRPLYSSSDEEEPRYDFIGEAVNIFASCDDLGQNKVHFAHEAWKYLNELYRLHVKGSETLTMSRSLLNTGAIFKDEARTWLGYIHRRLIARPRIRKPWYFEFTRDIPKEIFLALKDALRSTNNPNLLTDINMDGNRKAFVISVTSLARVVSLFTELTEFSNRNVKSYLARKVTRSKGIAKVIVSDVKDFALVYKFAKRQLSINCHYGFWNTYGFPQHD
ncbi:Hypothetical predicted protein [Paramuricea clavata]|uniref:Uncharacterized protein n=1 Tax=Paramuricea clavata TaxID=317549 RepID=A0A6S7K5Q7_PARCT|nr:Hypothetical predicted protein [Paramuricea clavata]